jgi:hypothetical protein
MDFYISSGNKNQNMIMYTYRLGVTSKYFINITITGLKNNPKSAKVKR